ncbi:aminoglycoside 3-N-acetyltransferase [Photorhabdus sp. P32]|uniref:aminoglycoside 3-N-acetyltransferase n=1 Tax=Photorhabdus sp. P32 TaxID=3117549 RepID=UPI00311B0F63
MLTIGNDRFWTKNLLKQQLSNLGLHKNDDVMVHASIRNLGTCINGPDDVIAAILETIGSSGTLLSYVNWNQNYEDAVDENGYLSEKIKVDITPFDAKFSRASSDHGILAEFIRTYPGSLRSGNPGASVSAIGKRAKWYTDNHSLQYGYGDNSPFAKLVEQKGKILMLGAPYDTMSLLHHAEHLANIPNKKIRHMPVPFLKDGSVIWEMIEEFDTVAPVSQNLPEGYFATIVTDFISAYPEIIGLSVVGNAKALLVPAAEILPFAVHWIESYSGSYS